MMSEKAKQTAHRKRLPTYENTTTLVPGGVTIMNEEALNFNPPPSTLIVAMNWRSQTYAREAKIGSHSQPRMDIKYFHSF